MLLRFHTPSVMHRSSGFTLVELIVVITILSILSTIGFITMSHQSSTARDGKRIAEIQDLANSTRLKTAQLKKLPLPTSESIALYVDPTGSGGTGSFVGYQGYMTNIIAQSLGYGQDNIKDPLDKTPYTYRVNQLQDKAQFLSYLENPRFQRTLTIAGYTPLIDTAHALEVDTSLFQDRYPYTTGDILGILIDKESNAPMQSNILNNNSNTTTGSLTLTPDSDTTYTLLLTEETTLSSLSSGSLTLMKDGLLQKKTLEEIAGEMSGGSNNNNGNSTGSSCSVSNPTSEQYFTFNSSTHTITDYDGVNGPKNVVIPCEIGGVVVESIGLSAFENKQLTVMSIPSSVINIGDQAFADNQLTTISIPENITSIGQYAFYGNQLSSLTFSTNTNVLIIWEYAFANNQLTTVNIPENITGIGAHAFQANQISTLNIADGLHHGSVIHEWAFASNQISILSIPDRFVTIGGYAFYENQLTSLTLTESITNIGEYAFTYQSSAGATIYGPSSGYVKDSYLDNSNNEFDKNIFTTYIDTP